MFKEFKREIFLSILCVFALMVSGFSSAPSVMAEEEEVTKIPPLATIVIDAGHGGKDGGAIRGDIYEKDITLYVSNLIGSILEEHNIEVIYSRNDDVELNDDKETDLLMRAELSKTYNADYFVSVHVNDFIDTSVSGFEIYVKDDDISHAFGQTVLNAIDSMNMTHNRGLRDGSSLRVLRLNTVPSLLIELGYINSSDIEFLKDEDKLGFYAQTIAEGIIYYIEHGADV